MKKILRAGAVFLLLILLFTVALMQGKQTKEQQEFVIHITGDIMLARGVAPYLLERGYTYPYEEVSPLFMEDDLTLGNLECPITEAGNGANKDKKFVFRAEIQNAEALYEAGYDCLNLANNHSMDYLSTGLLDTMEHLQNAGVATVGAGRDASEDASFVWEKDGYRIGVLAFSALPPEGLFYDANAPTISYISSFNEEDVAEKIKSLDCDFKIVYFHWGTEYMPYPTEKQKHYAALAVESGANLVVGAHPHVLGESEVLEGVPIYYSLGNFVFDRQIPRGTDETMILEVVLDRETGIKEIKEIPAHIKEAQVVPD